MSPWAVAYIMTATEISSLEHRYWKSGAAVKEMTSGDEDGMRFSEWHIAIAVCKNCRNGFPS